MQFSVTFRHMEATDGLKQYAKERVERIKKYFPDPIAVNVVMSTERGYSHRADINVQLHNGIKLAGRESTENMYSSIDLVVAKIERQIRKYKNKLRARKTKSSFSPVPWTHSVLSDETLLGDATEEASDNAAENAAEGPLDQVVKRTEKFHADPMSVRRAIMQLDLLHEQFLVFRNSDTGEVNVVYRRGDGTFGLIETAKPAENRTVA